MEVPRKSWINFITKLSKINEKAKDDFVSWVLQRGGYLAIDREELTDYAYAIVTKYGEASSALTAEFYDAVAELEGVYVPPAIPAPTPTYSEVAKAVNGTMKSGNLEIIGNAINRLVKLTGVDTTVQNAIRDGAEWAWIPSGDTCAFCITLASNGWQRASDKILKGGHATHVHANCDCTFAIRHDSRTEFAGYDPQRYRDMYYDAPLDGEAPNAKNRINAMRREFYAENKAEINAQKRDAYAKRVALNSSAAEETKV